MDSIALLRAKDHPQPMTVNMFHLVNLGNPANRTFFFWLFLANLTA
jgi:hypothetical protein